MATYIVTASRKTGNGQYEHELISGVCVSGDYHTKETVYDSLMLGHTWIARRPGYPDVEIEPKLHNGHKYIQTKPDQFRQNNLLNLPNC